MRPKTRKYYKSSIKTFSAIVALFLFSCQTSSITQDNKKNTNKQIEKSYPIINKSSNFNNTLKIPEFISPISKPSFDPDIKNEKLVTLNTSEETPIKAVLEELARISGLDIDISPDVSGSVIINANKKPIREIINRISEVGDIRHRIKNNTIIFFKDYPYIKHYSANFIIDEDIWGSLEEGIKDILNKNEELKQPLPSSLNVISKTVSNNNPETNKDDKGVNKENQNPESSVFINKEAGIITIFANDKSHKMVSEYLVKVEERSSAQVLIEAKVIEVFLKEEYNSGIDWNILQKGSSATANNLSIDLANSLSAFSIQDIAASIAILKTFGETRTIQSPRVTTLHNQKAKLDFTDKLVYFEIKETAVAASGGGSEGTTATSKNSTVKEENVGVVLEITPSINAKDNTIKLKLNPSISILSDTVQDPINEANKIPIIQERKIETVMKIKSGSTLVMGGLMKDELIENSTGFPILSKIPVIKYFFKRDNENLRKTQTVIFIKATILENNSLNKEDNKLLHTSIDN